MSSIRLKSLKVSNYRSFGEEQAFEFPDQSKKPMAIIGYNNCGKTNLMNSILFGIGEKFVNEKTFEKTDLHKLDYQNKIQIETEIVASSYTVAGMSKSIGGVHSVSTYIQDDEITSKVSPSFFGANKHYNIFYINFHDIKDEISMKKTSWGNLTSFLAKHIRKTVDSDAVMKGKKSTFVKETKESTEAVLRDSQLEKFIELIKQNYAANLRGNNCVVEFGLPDYEDIFLQMLFKIGLNGDQTTLVPITHFGDGYISMFVMAVIQAIAESNPDDECLFLFEEPESFLHENHQEYFYETVLCGLAEKGHQVIYTTHSDKMINLFDTENIIRLEFDESKKQTINKYNSISGLTTESVTNAETGEVITLKTYNEFVKTIEPNLNKILFSRKVVLVEGPNDLMAYRHAIAEKVFGIKRDRKYAESYLSFNNFSLVPHHGKITALLLIQLCKHMGVDYFVINDWDLPEFVDLSSYPSEGELKSGAEYAGSASKAVLTTNWKLLNAAGNEKIHFNIPKLEGVLGYEVDENDKLKYKNKGDSVFLWEHLKSMSFFEPEFFPAKLEAFLEINNLQTPSIDSLLEQSAPAIADPIDYGMDRPRVEDLPF